MFSKTKFRAEDYQSAIDDLKDVKFTRFTDNFIRLMGSFPEIQWFDPEWSTVAHNAGIVARIAKQTGLRPGDL